MPTGMILAAGRGTRLGPLTQYTPKPLLPVANRPVMEQGITSLRRAGITEISTNVSYRGEQIIAALGDGSTLGVTLRWSTEPTPMGTAGGMKGLADHLRSGEIIVIAGDAMLDIDLAPLLRAHREHGAFASLATLRVDDPSQYGVVVTDATYRIQRFQEKPAPGSAISHQANTGIYIFAPEILDLIPGNQFYDFALHVFPEILQRDLPFYAFPVEGYWTDVGNPGEYLRANLDFLDGQIRIAGRGRQVGDNLIEDSARVTGADLRRCVIGAKVEIPAGSQLRDCVAWSGTILTEPVTLTSAVLTPYGCYQIDGNAARQLPTSGLTVASV